MSLGKPFHISGPQFLPLCDGNQSRLVPPPPRVIMEIGHKQIMILPGSLKKLSKS